MTAAKADEAEPEAGYPPLLLPYELKLPEDAVNVNVASLTLVLLGVRALNVTPSAVSEVGDEFPLPLLPIGEL